MVPLFHSHKVEIVADLFLCKFDNYVPTKILTQF